jgi:hypothetical protein
VAVGLGSAALAAGFFWMWRLLQYPVLAYLDAALYGLLALLAAATAAGTWLGRGDAEPTPDSGSGREALTRPEGRDGPGQGRV